MQISLNSSNRTHVSLDILLIKVLYCTHAGEGLAARRLVQPVTPGSAFGRGISGWYVSGLPAGKLAKVIPFPLQVQNIRSRFVLYRSDQIGNGEKDDFFLLQEMQKELEDELYGIG